MAKNLLSKGVIYRDASGFEKAATVIGTHESIQAGTDVTRPAEGRANLLIFKAGSGETYVRTNIAEGDGPRTFSRR